MQGEIEIILGGKPQKLKYCMRAIEENQRLLAESKGPIYYSTTANTVALIYAGLLSQYYYEKKDVDFSKEDVSGWVYELFDEENGMEQINAVMDCFLSCNAYKNLQKSTDEDKKKSSNGMTSTPLLSES
jgi:hypothetical protein